MDRQAGEDSCKRASLRNRVVRSSVGTSNDMTARMCRQAGTGIQDVRPLTHAHGGYAPFGRLLRQLAHLVRTGASQHKRFGSCCHKIMQAAADASGAAADASGAIFALGARTGPHKSDQLCTRVKLEEYFTFAAVLSLSSFPSSFSFSSSSPPPLLLYPTTAYANLLLSPGPSLWSGRHRHWHLDRHFCARCCVVIDLEYHLCFNILLRPFFFMLLLL